MGCVRSLPVAPAGGKAATSLSGSEVHTHTPDEPQHATAHSRMPRTPSMRTMKQSMGSDRGDALVSFSGPSTSTNTGGADEEARAHTRTHTRTHTRPQTRFNTVVDATAAAVEEEEDAEAATMAAVRGFVVEAWAQHAEASMRMLLDANTHTRRHFERFLASECNLNHASFYQEVQALKNDTDGSATWAAAQQIYAKYVQAGSSEEVNLSAALRGGLVRGSHVRVLSAAQDEVVRMMALDAFPRFLRSRHCDELLAEVMEAGDASGHAGAGPDGTLARSLRYAREGMQRGRGRWLDLFKAVAEMVPECIVIADMQRAGVPIIHANQAFYSLTGYTRSEVIGRNCRLLQGEGTSQATVERIRSAIRHGEHLHCEILNYKKGGIPFRNFLTLSPVFECAPETSADTGSTLDLVSTSSSLLDDAGGHAPHGAANPDAQPRRKLLYYIGLQFEVTDDAIVTSRLIKHATLLRMLPKFAML